MNVPTDDYDAAMYAQWIELAAYSTYTRAADAMQEHTEARYGSDVSLAGNCGTRKD